MQPPTEWEALVARFAEPHRELVVRFALEAPKHFSPAGCEYYRRGVEALLNLGRGEKLALAYLEAAPAVAREVGEDAAEAARREAAKLASMTSGEVIERFLATLPLVARRLGDADLFTNYLTFVHQLASLAPRALRPLFAHLEPLLDTLTLGGLRRWALFGAELHHQDTAALTAYFSLESAEAKAKLQEERRGTLFVDSHRKLNAYLRALWGRDFWLKPAQADRNEFRPFVDDFVRVLGDYRVLLDEVKRREFSDVKEYEPLRQPAIYDSGYNYYGYVPFVVMNDWHASNVQTHEQQTSGGGTSAGVASSGFTAAGSSSSF